MTGDEAPDQANPGPADPAPADPGLADPRPVDPGLADPRPVDPGSVDPRPADPRPVDPGSVDPGSVDPRWVDPSLANPGLINPGTTEHPHRQIADLLRQRIRAGEWGAGERLPSIPALAEAYGVAKQTVQRTIDALRVEGLLITRPGSGTFVRGSRRRLNRLARGRYGSRRGYHADLAARYRQQLLTAGRTPAPPEVADAFGVSAGAPLIRRQHLVRTDEQQPVELGASWFLPADAENTSLIHELAYGRPLYQEVEDVTGRHYTTAADHISARLPSREEAQILQIRPDTPVLHLLHVAYDADRRPIEVAQATWPGPMTTLSETYAVPGDSPTTPTGPDAALA